MTKHQAVAGTRQQNNWLIAFQLLAALLALLMVGMGFASFLAYSSAVSEICPLTVEQCQRQLQFTPAELANFQQSPISFDFAVLFRYATLASAAGLSCVLGAFIMVRKSDDWMALFVGLFLISLSLGNSGPTSAFVRVYPALAPLMQALIVVQAALFVLFFVLFPNGRPEPRWMRWAGPVACLYYVGIILAPNLIEFVSRPSIFSVLLITASSGMFVMLLVAQVIRYRYYSNSKERQQTRWVVFGVVLYFAVLLATVFFVVPFQTGQNRWLFFFLGTLGFNGSSFILPVTISLAVMRSRLFDIDIIIRRTLQYSVLSGLLGLIYFGLITVLQSLFQSLSGQQSEISIVLSTLAIAALFFPLRNRVQEFIDKRFYRKKYDAQKVLAEFAATCRDETNLDKLVARLAEVIDETLQPEKVSVWIKPAANEKNSPLRDKF